MRAALISTLLTIALLSIGCAGETVEVTPVDTLKAYTEAVKNKDITQMKLLLSAATLKLHTDQAKAQNVTLDEIVQRETLFPPEQRRFTFRNEKIEGEKATVEVMNNFNGWDTIFLVKEEGTWKIDKKTTAQQIIDQSDTEMEKLDEQIDAGRIDLDEVDSQSPTPTGTPANVEPIEPPQGGVTPAEPGSDVPGSPPVSPPAQQP